MVFEGLRLLENIPLSGSVRSRRDDGFKSSAAPWGSMT
jgi:hypothetical protein